MGRFEIQSEVGAGCQVRVELPLEEVFYSFQAEPRYSGLQLCCQTRLLLLNQLPKR